MAMHLYPDHSHPIGISGRPWFLVKDDKLFPDVGHPKRVDFKPWFRIKDGKVYTAEGHPDGRRHPILVPDSIVSESPTEWAVDRSITTYRSCGPASVPSKPFVLWLPSQNGLLLEPPQRHRE